MLTPSQAVWLWADRLGVSATCSAVSGLCRSLWWLTSCTTSSSQPQVSLQCIANVLSELVPFVQCLSIRTMIVQPRLSFCKRLMLLSLGTRPPSSDTCENVFSLHVVNIVHWTHTQHDQNRRHSWTPNMPCCYIKIFDVIKKCKALWAVQLTGYCAI